MHMFSQLLTEILASIGVLSAVLTPLGIWDHLVPHIDITREWEDHEEQEAEREVQAYLENILREERDAERERYNKEWTERELGIWDRERHEFIPKDQWERENRGTLANDYGGTCGPPDRDR